MRIFVTAITTSNYGRPWFRMANTGTILFLGAYTLDEPFQIGFTVWKRRTFHECALELEGASNQFRRAYLDLALDADVRNKHLSDSSTRGVEILRILSLAIRTEQDVGLTARDKTPVGAITTGLSKKDVEKLLADYQPPWTQRSVFEHLVLREALNKIAHMDPAQSDFRVDAQNHELLLGGKYRGDGWFAVISIPELCRVIKTLPDVRITPRSREA